MSTPYTYLIGWSDKDTFYYGVRYANGCHPSELWKTYFTSSKYVKSFVEENGSPDIIKVRKTFTNTDLARFWEHKVLRRFNVRSDNRFLNKTDNISMPILLGKDNPMFGKTRVFTDEWKRNMSKSCVGRRPPFTGLKHTDETKIRISKTKLSREDLTCNKCGKTVSEGNYYRWHGDQCGIQKSSGTEKMIKIENTTYRSLGDAAKALGVSNATITYRIKSPNFNYNILGGV